ncbi:S9 family peptidase [Tautonia sociabilis]|uniref:S9 family peptidase n=2 Tax=Tautonia sociabilis TaxID=2080755 RepID=A0A432MQP3_9BACT|nr:S9 family peptidase [Tautonia sociabilis]
MLPTLTPIALAVLLLTASIALAAPSSQGLPVGLDDAARHPAPGTTTPTAIAFSPDGAAVTFLYPEGEGPGRVLWRLPAAEGARPEVVARPPGEGNTDENVSPEEALRRERMRLRDTGISQIVRSPTEDASLLPLNGDLYLLRGDGPLRRLTETEAPEIDPKFSPDGSRVGFVRAGELYVLDVETGAETRLTGDAAEGVSNGLAEFIAQEELGRSTGFWWSPDGSRIAFQQTDERHIPEFVIVHQGDDTPSTESHRYPFAGAENARVRLGVVASTGGEPQWLDVAEDGEEAYLARVCWDGPGHLLVQVLPRDQKSLRLVRIDVETNERSTLVEETSRSWVNLHDDLALVPGTGEIVWSTERSGFRHLMLLDREGKPIRALTSGEWPVDALVHLDPDRREVWFLAGRESPLRRDLYRVSLDGGPVELVTAGEGYCSDAVVSPDADQFVATVSSTNRPPVSTLRDRSGRVLATLADSGTDPRLSALDLIRPRLLKFTNRDGETLFGAYYEPRSVDLGVKAPLVVLVYGGPHVQRVTDSWALTADMTAQYLSALGFAVWKCDNRGSSRRGLAFESALDRNLGTVEVLDQVDGVRFVCSTVPSADPDRVGITGGSYGGYMTIRSLLLAPEVFDAGVAIAPVTDWDGYDTGYTERYMGTPADNPEGYASSSVLDKADRLKGDLLLIHGLLDENVHFRHTARLVSALIRAGKPFEVLPIPDERHSTRKRENRRAILDRTARFFEEHLRGG